MEKVNLIHMILLWPKEEACFPEHFGLKMKKSAPCYFLGHIRSRSLKVYTYREISDREFRAKFSIPRL